MCSSAFGYWRIDLYYIHITWTNYRMSTRMGTHHKHLHGKILTGLRRDRETPSLCVPMWMWSPIQPNTCECFIYFPHTNDSISGIQTIHILIFKSMPTSFLPCVRTSFFIHLFPYPRLCPDICYSFFLSFWPRSF